MKSYMSCIPSLSRQNSHCQWLNTRKKCPRNSTVLEKKMGTEILKSRFYPGDLVTRTREREIGAVSGRVRILCSYVIPPAGFSRASFQKNLFRPRRVSKKQVSGLALHL